MVIIADSRSVSTTAPKRDLVADVCYSVSKPDQNVSQNLMTAKLKLRDSDFFELLALR